MKERKRKESEEVGRPHFQILRHFVPIDQRQRAHP